MTSIGSNIITYDYLKKDKNPVSERMFRNILNGFHQHIVDKVLDGEIVRLPERLGELKIVGRKVKPTIDPETGHIKGLFPDWKATKELWAKSLKCKAEKQLVFHLNEHSSGIRYYIKWSKLRVAIKNREFYSFKAARVFSRALRDNILNGKEYFCEN